MTGTLATTAAPNAVNFPPYPSLHRPELVQYWINKISPTPNNTWSKFLGSGSVGVNLALARQIMLRPIGAAPIPSGSSTVWVDHPNFTGSNPGNANSSGLFDPVNGPWDVDNDGDGIADSVWVDLGSPVQTATDGTIYKPLYAIRVLDLDGRLNVNAHGNSGQLETAYNTLAPVTANFAGAGGNVQNPLTPSTLTPTAAAATTNPAPGSGYGTAEINLEPLFTQQTGLNAATQYQYLLAGNTSLTGSATATYEGRYGESPSGMSTTSATYDSTQQPSASTPPYAGLTLSGDVELTASALGLVKHWDLPFPGYPTMLTAYGSAPDLWGRSFTALDIGGTPLMPTLSATPFQSTTAATTWAGGLGGQNDTINNPYVLNLSRGSGRGVKSTGAIDNPFTPLELERLLRPYDSDVGTLAPRLAALLGVTSLSTAPSGTTVSPVTLLLRQVTTDSFDLPSPNLLMANTAAALSRANLAARTVLSPAPFASSAADLLTARIAAAGGLSGDPMLSGTHSGWNNIPIQLQLMLPPDLLNGQRFDINRPFGNGRDDDQDGVVDEPDEYYLGEPAWIVPSGSAAPMNSGTSPFASGSSSGASSAAINLSIDWNGDGTIDQNDALMARHIMARHLYVLAMLLVDPALLNTKTSATLNQSTAILYDDDGPKGFSLNNNKTQIQYALAQWAINAVDFRDRDSTMTPFEFDINPFDGWGVDGVLSTADDASSERGLVWGSERPELLITETLAWHDRRTEDLTNGGGTVSNGDYGSGSATSPKTPDFDQRLMPMPACFIELYNPWTTQYSELSTATGEQTGAPSAAEVPGEFYFDTNTANPGFAPYATYPTAQQPIGVVLNKTAIDPSGMTAPSPVWRMIFVNNGANIIAGGTQVPAYPPSAAGPDPRMIDPDDPIPGNLTGAGGGPVFANYIDRIVYFVAPTGTYPAGFPSANCVAYYPGPMQPTPASLKPGRYAVIGSVGEAAGSPGGAAYTNMSKLGRTSTANDNDADPNSNLRRIVLTPSASTQANQVTIYNSGQTATEPGPLLGGGAAVQGAQNAVAIALDYALSSTGTPGARSFAISDPIAGYPAGNGTDGAGETLCAAIANSPYDVPITGGDPNIPSMMLNQTIPWYRTVHLQRLANPQMPYNATTNPYMTIDSASVDVTAFNGVSTTQDPTPSGGTQSASSGPLCSTQRGDQYVLPATVPTSSTSRPQSLASQANLLWVHEFAHTTGAGVLSTGHSQGSAPNSIFTPALNHSIGYLSQMYGIASGAANAPYTAAASTAFTSANYPAPSPYLGMPTTPFPWLQWNNRPYTTPLELALVPKSRSSRLLFDYSGGNATAATTLYNSQSGAVVLKPNYFPTGGASAIDAGTATVPFFGHLLNFFDEASTLATSVPSAGNLYRLFEYLQVPSRFVGTETVLSPLGSTYGIMNSNAASTTPTLLSGDAASGAKPAWNNSTSVPYTLGSSALGTYLRPPLNKVSEFRDPGRVNINTVQDPVVWQGVVGGSYYPQLAPLTATGTPPPNIAGTMITTLSGTTTPTASTGSPATGVAVGNGLPATVPTNMPSYFINPFRSFSGAALTNSIYASSSYTAPAYSATSQSFVTIGLKAPYAHGIGLFGTANALHDLDTTLLRPSSVGITTGTALFDSQVLAAAGTPQPYNDPTRSPFFRLQNSSRMTNLLTTRSNVYAVWITVGYFQVTPWYGYTSPPSPTIVYDTAHQDGYQLGQELGGDSGQITRHRAFYLFDRTIPVGFQRGVNHNVQNAILLRRYIE